MGPQQIIINTAEVAQNNPITSIFIGVASPVLIYLLRRVYIYILTRRWKILLKSLTDKHLEIIRLAYASKDAVENIQHGNCLEYLLKNKLVLKIRESENEVYIIINPIVRKIIDSNVDLLSG